jgi:hypothetical protein
MGGLPNQNTGRVFCENSLSVLRTRLLLTGLLLVMAFLAMPLTVQAEEEPVCAIDGTQYETLDAALAAIGNGESKTIRLLKNINYAGTMTITGKTVTFDLNGYELWVSNVLGNGLEVNSAVVDMAGNGWVLRNRFRKSRAWCHCRKWRAGHCN